MKKIIASAIIAAKEQSLVIDLVVDGKCPMSVMLAG
jgi:hypothetical protein